MIEPETDDTPPDPIVEQQVEAAVVLYRGLLPEKVLEDFGLVVRMTLDLHPVGTSLVARLRPAILVATELGENAENRGFQGFAFGHMVHAMMTHLGEFARKEGRVEFSLPDASLRAFVAFIGYLKYDESIWGLADAEARAVAGVFCDCILGALLLGLVQELVLRPARVKEWGEAGRALAGALPRLRAILRRAMSNMPRNSKGFLEAYEACRWDEDRAAQKLRLAKRIVNERCQAAMRDLAIALRPALEAGANIPQPTG